MKREQDGSIARAGKGDDFGRDDRSGLFGEEEAARRMGPSWRALVLSIVVAIVLSVTATLLLGGSFGSARVASSTGCAPGSECCPPAGK